ncbi:MAG: type I-G CRISPR-associated helicase/endonuclease Cas3g [Acidimicrobiales bacterium]
MTALAAAHFPAFYQAVHGFEPFTWQVTLAERVLGKEGWPAGIDVPTGMGKTSVIDVAVFALAAQAGNGDRRTAPTRTFVVVDRRLIVDQAYDHAGRLARVLQDPAPGTVVERVATGLRSLTDGGPPLEVCRMRGGTTWSWRWLARPSQPAVVVATVDQYGSRLLFRGYGVGSNLRPIDAALCGTDALLVLDEAHLSTPLVETLGSTVAHQAWAEHPVLPARPARSVLLSATLPSRVVAWRPDLGAETGEVARRRLDVERVAHLVEVRTRKDPAPDLAAALAALARDGIGRPGVERVGVVCNTVRMARDVYGLLRDAGPVGADVVLLVGRCRPVERELIAEQWLPRLKAEEERPAAAQVIAVATQTIEVGADLDVDLLITEAAPVDALLQRLGRLDRFGRAGRSGAVVVHAPNRHDDDPVYGAATGRTWRWLVEQAGSPEAAKPADVVRAWEEAPWLDLGPRHLAELLTPDARRELAAEPSLAPVALGPVLDAWARTSPAPEPDQPVAPYLHGIARPAAEVEVCWRAGLPDNDHGAWVEELASAPVTAAETVSVPIWEAARFLAGHPDTGRLGDLEGATDDLDVDLEESPRVGAVLLSAEGEVIQVGARRLRPGDTVVVDSGAGGHDQWGWTGVSGAFVPDVADLAARRRPRLRLRPAVLGIDPAADPELAAACERAGTGPGDDPGEERAWAGLLLQRIAVALGGGPEAPPVDETTAGLDDEGAGALEAAVLADDIGAVETAELAEVADHAVPAPGPVAPARLPPALARRMALLAAELVDDPSWYPRRAEAGWSVYEGRPRRTVAGRASGEAFDDAVGDEVEQASSAAGRQVSLEDHLWDVAKIAAGEAGRLGLATELVKAVELAGRAHDMGKADRRFQAMLHGGDKMRALAAPAPLAKSGMDPSDRVAFRRAQRESGWPSGMRHESISAAMVAEMVRSSPGLFEEVDTELVLHLVQSHHGRARPLLPPVSDDAPGPVPGELPRSGDRSLPVEVASDLGLVDWEGPARFAALGRRYGWWGLALLESVVRLADMQASASYEAAAVTP